MLAVEVAAWYRSRGMTLYDGMQEFVPHLRLFL